ncbi:hypothetical protein LJR289_004316 [Pseudoduganella sp. LjRoot289]|uniref:hypothetical protein n=1 Tax=Pseudoduganella sp. LjRoot289 TaxID=3342314 RepID=UPI003ECEF93D
MQNRLVMAGAAGIPRTWETLLSQALRVVGEIARHGRDDPFWTFGGGTVLMLQVHIVRHLRKSVAAACCSS